MILLKSGLMSLVLGILVELFADKFNLWKYRNRFWLGFNLIIVFGLTFGSMAACLTDETFLFQYASGFIFGILYESANFAFLNAWYFNGDRLLFLKGKPALVIGISILWGLIVPVVTAVIKIF